MLGKGHLLLSNKTCHETLQLYIGGPCAWGMIVDTNLGGGWGRGLEIKEISKEIFIH